VIYEYGELLINDNDREKQKNSVKTYPSANSSTRNPTWNDPGANSGLPNDRPATNRLMFEAGVESWGQTDTVTLYAFSSCTSCKEFKMSNFARLADW
jgi:hypothetical protein